MIKKILFYKENKFYWEKGDLHNQFGRINEKDIINAKSGSHVKSNIGKEFLVLDASMLDNLEKIKRGPAVMIAKDIGWLLVNTGIDKESTVLEAGSGSGMLTVNLARFCKKVVSYERNKEFYEIAKSNIENLELKNVTIKNKDVDNEIDEKELDACFLDMLEPWLALKNVHNALKPAGYVACYVTNVNQLSKIVEELGKTGFMMERAAEIIEREWHVEGMKVRPVSSIIGHTGFLTIARKI